MNSELYGTIIEIPKDMLDHLTVCFDQFPDSNANVEGHKRNIYLRDNSKVTYQQLGRIKNWFDSYEGEKEDAPFVLNGGDKMHTWVNRTLESLRNGTQVGQEIVNDVKPEDISDDLIDNMGWLSNMNRSSKNNSKFNDDIKITESLKRINSIINKLI